MPNFLIEQNKELFFLTLCFLPPFLNSFLSSFLISFYIPELRKISVKQMNTFQVSMTSFTFCRTNNAVFSNGAARSAWISNDVTQSCKH